MLRNDIEHLMEKLPLVKIQMNENGFCSWRIAIFIEVPQPSTFSYINQYLRSVFFFSSPLKPNNLAVQVLNTVIRLK